MSDLTRFTPRNYWAFVVEGGLFGAGMAFVSLDTVLPTMVHELGGADSLIAFLPIAMLLGMNVPPLLTAHWLERMGRLMPVLRWFCFLQRVPYAIAALMLWFFALNHPRLAVVVVVLVPVLSGVFGGVVVAAWYRLTCRIVPGSRRSSAMALRGLIAAVSGIGVGFAVQRVFVIFPGPTGFAILHLLAFGVLMLAYAVLCLSDEPDSCAPPQEHHQSLGWQLRSLIPTLRTDRGFASFALSQACNALVYVSVPFMALHASRSTGLGPSFAGQLLVWQMGGGVIGSLLAGWLGDHKGSRLVLIAAKGISLLMLTLFACSSSPIGYSVSFALWGGAVAMQIIGESTFIAEHAFGPRMPTYVSISSLASVCGMLASAIISSLLLHPSDGMMPLLSVSALGLGAAFLINLTSTPEPRCRVSC